MLALYEAERGAAEESRKGRNHADLSFAPRHEAIDQRLDGVQYPRDVDCDGPVRRIEGFDSQVVLVERYPGVGNQQVDWMGVVERLQPVRHCGSIGGVDRSGEHRRSLGPAGIRDHRQAPGVTTRQAENDARSRIVDGQCLPDATRSASNDDVAECFHVGADTLK